jgi:transcriptional regulator with XRE-family HTH domain
MANANRDRIGARIAAIRKTRGWTARELARREARHHPMVREAIQAIAHAEPRPSEGLRSFASWLGIDSWLGIGS